MTQDEQIEMLKEAQTKAAATIAAHEEFLVVLLGRLFRELSKAQRDAMVEAMARGPNMDAPSFALTNDIGVADEIAGLALARRDAINRLAQRAIVAADRLTNR